MPGTKPNCLRVLWLTLVLLVAFAAGVSVRIRPAMTAEVRRSAPRQHFLAGSERALPVLQEISQTLKQIDARLSRIEKIAAAAAEP